MKINKETLGLIGDLVNVGGVLFDKDKPKTTKATGAGIGLGGLATLLINSGEPNLVLVGYALGLVSAGLVLYKDKK